MHTKNQGKKDKQKPLKTFKKLGGGLDESVNYFKSESRSQDAAGMMHLRKASLEAGMGLGHFPLQIL